MTVGELINILETMDREKDIVIIDEVGEEHEIVKVGTSLLTSWISAVGE